MKTIVLLTVALLTAGLFIAPPRSAPTNRAAFAAPGPTPFDKPPFAGYKGVTIGTSMVDVRVKLGAPKDASDEQDSFAFSPQESAEVYYNTATHTVRALTIMYSGKLEGAPAPKDVFGQDAEVKPDGGIFKKVDYPKAGFWISYNKTGGDEPMIMIAMNKM